MKYMLYFLISIVLLAMPLLKNYKILMDGEQVKGLVTDHKETMSQSEFYNLGSEYSVIQVDYKGQRTQLYGPENEIYEIGSEVSLLILPENPEEFVFVSFSGIYMNKTFPIAIGTFLLWSAIFFSFSKRKKDTKK